MNVYERALEQHKQWRGKVEIVSRATVKTQLNSASLTHQELPNPVAASQQTPKQSGN